MTRRQPRPGQTALARQIRRRDWERVALLLLLAMAEAARRLPPGDIDDLLALLAPAGPSADDAPAGPARRGPP